MSGNLLGPRATYIYTPDVAGTLYLYTTDEDLAIPGLGAGAAAPVEFDPANPPTPVPQAAPKNFTFRTVFAQDAAGNRKSLIVADPTAALFNTTIRTAIPDLAGATDFVTTGRKGETLSFL